MKSRNFHRILVANRGEIASRIIRSIQGLQMKSVAIYALNDRELPYVSEADESFSLGSGSLAQTYLNIELILKIARESGADAIHPGYGFLAENADFARACKESGISFIGPTAEQIDQMGNKARARDMASKIGIPILEGQSGELSALLKNQQELPYPLLIKPAAGGGGKGMRIINSPDEMEQEAGEASREAFNYFGSGELYVERFLEETRHVEVQVLADEHGNRVHLYERECSLQRRYQKIIEEAPSSHISEHTRKLLFSAALKLIAAINYTNAGTVEFLVDGNQDFYFMEMNTRIQVEHPVTELITGVDLVKEQIRIAQGLPLSFSQEEIRMDGHGLEVRLYAEDPEQKFLPSSGTLDTFDLPANKDLRIDNAYKTGNQVVSSYDPLLGKLIVRGNNREQARTRMISALKEIHIAGLHSNRDFLLALLKSRHFRENRIHTRLLDAESLTLISSLKKQKDGKDREILAAVAAFIALNSIHEVKKRDRLSPWHVLGHWRLLPSLTLSLGQDSYQVNYKQLRETGEMLFLIADREIQIRLVKQDKRNYHMLVNGQSLKLWAFTRQSEIYLDLDGVNIAFRRLDVLDRRYIRSDNFPKSTGKGELSAPLNGRIVDIPVKEGDRVAEGLPLVVVESMKMENKLLAENEVIVKQIKVIPGQLVQTNQILLTLAPL